MYGVVLMMALSGGADVPAMSNVSAEPVARYGDNSHKEYRCGCNGGRRGGRCHGGGGCYGGGCYGGGGYGGCYGGRGGCYGGGCYGGGGYGGCYGGGGGCYGGGGGCYGGGGGRYGAYGYGAWDGGMPSATGYYGYSPYGSTMYYSSTPYNSSINSGNIPMEYSYGTPLDQGARYGERGLTSGEATATITVRLPADAKLTVDGAATRSTEAMRVFVSPPLQAGKSYTYSLRAEVTRDGKKVEKTRDVTVRAGEPQEVTFDLPPEGGSSNK